VCLQELTSVQCHLSSVVLTIHIGCLGASGDEVVNSRSWFKSGDLQTRWLCSHGQQSGTSSAAAGWASSKPCCRFLRQETDKSVSPVGVKTVATCHSVLGLLELYAQLIGPIGQLNSGKAEI